MRVQLVNVTKLYTRKIVWTLKTLQLELDAKIMVSAAFVPLA